MSKLCKITFKFSDIVSGGIFGLGSLALLLSFVLPPFGLITAVIVNGLSLGVGGFLYLIAFMCLNYFSFKRRLEALLGHLFLIILLAVLGSGFSYLYTVLFIIYLLPFYFAFREVEKYNNSSNADAASRTGS